MSTPQSDQAVPAEVPSEDRKTISLPAEFYERFAHYAIEEIDAYADVGEISGEQRMLITPIRALIETIRACRPRAEIDAAVASVLAAVRDLDQAFRDLLDGTRRALAEYEEAADAEPSLVSAKDLERIDAEIGRRTEKSAEVSRLQEQLEDELAEIDRRLDTARQILASKAYDREQAVRNEIQGLEKNRTSKATEIATLIEGDSENQRKTNLLVRYREAMRTLRKPLPKKIFSERL